MLTRPLPPVFAASRLVAREPPWNTVLMALAAEPMLPVPLFRVTEDGLPPATRMLPPVCRMLPLTVISVTVWPATVPAVCVMPPPPPVVRVTVAGVPVPVTLAPTVMLPLFVLVLPGPPVFVVNISTMLPLTAPPMLMLACTADVGLLPVALTEKVPAAVDVCSGWLI